VGGCPRCLKSDFLSINMNTNTKTGLMGIGLDTYWPQFENLLENLTGYQNQIKQQLENFGATVVDAGLVDNPVKAREVADFLKNF